ncbi:MAG: DUF3109 family protein [Bacteroidetes bacterium]|nr:DUF3109 family protein [Bacteroidota bacterium]
MIIVGKVIVAEPILERKFACQLDSCKGACCVQGDSGAPLLEEELEIIRDELPKIKPFMSKEGIELLEEKGFYETDSEGDLGTVCRPSGECVFVNMENGIAICAIEKAYYAKETWFKKPISCHLYPIRARQYGDYIALNYHHWDICSAACKAGEEMKVPVYTFLHDALVRKFGPSWYRELVEVAQAWEKR